MREGEINQDEIVRGLAAGLPAVARAIEAFHQFGEAAARVGVVLDRELAPALWLLQSPARRRRETKRFIREELLKRKMLSA